MMFMPAMLTRAGLLLGRLAADSLEQKSVFQGMGEVQTNYPNQDQDYHVFLMNLGPTTNAHYALIDEWIDNGEEYARLHFSPAVKWHRKDLDGYTGPEGGI